MENAQEHDPNPLTMLTTAHDMIARTRSTIVNRSFHFFLWGILVGAACLITFLSGEGDSNNIPWFPWAILMPLGGIISTIYCIRRRRTAHAMTIAEHTYDGIWFAAGMGALALVIGNAATHKLPPQMMYLLFSVIAGNAVYASGHVMGLWSFKLGAVCWWCGAILMMFLPARVHPLIMAIVIVPGYLLPGYLLQRSVRAESGK